MGTLVLLVLGVLVLFGAAPIIQVALTSKESYKGGFNIGGVNLSSQIFDGVRGLVDSDTPMQARTRMSMDGKKKMKLVFSDEFETPGRSFVSSSGESRAVRRFTDAALRNVSGLETIHS